MKIAVVAAHGRSGQQFVKAALAAGHEVQAGIFGIDPFIPHPKLVTMQCNATDDRHIQRLIAGTEAVVSAIGHSKKSDKDVQTQAMLRLVTYMKQAEIPRLISITGTGVRTDGDQPRAVDRLLNFMVRLVDPARVRDGMAHVEVLRGSDLDWTVIRCLKLNERKPKDFTLTQHGPSKVRTSRDEVAQAILDVLEKNTFIHELPVISRMRG